MTTTAPARILILPGLGGSGPEHWQSRWEQLDRRCARVEQGDWDRPGRAAWVEALDRAVGPAEAGRGPTFLVAHSLACALVAHWAATVPPGVGAAARVAGALLVAPADVDEPERTPLETRSFAPMPLGPLPFPSTVIASRDDPYVAFERAWAFADSWGAGFVDAGALGHLNAASGLGDWPEGRRHLDALISEAEWAVRAAAERGGRA